MSINDNIVVLYIFIVIGYTIWRRAMLFNAPNLVVLDILEHHIAKH